MTAQKWQAGTSYAPGAIVQPKTATAAELSALSNGGFEGGDTDWTKDAGWAITNVSGAFAGSWFARYTGTGEGEMENPPVAVVPGWEIRASALLKVASGDSARVVISWQDESFSELGTTDGDEITAQAYTRSVAQGKAPSGTAYAQFKILADTASAGPVDADQAQWELVSGTSALSELLFQATQASAALSGATEPTWPDAVSETVTDGGVTWTAISANIIRWEASPVLETGSSEPTWPTTIGSMVADGSIAWECFARHVEDANCPNSKIVIIADSKVYAGDDDLVRFCATVNPLDWTSENDAGYLPFGLNDYGSNPVAALGLYRGDLIAANAEGFQRWDVDVDPAQMAFVDALPIGTTEHLALTPVGNELLLLTPEGVRDLSTSAVTNNLKAGAIGAPVDALVLEKLAAAKAAGKAVLGTYWPGMGQVWIAFPETSTTTVFVCTRNRQEAAWSRYVYPFAIEAFAHLGDDLYMRAGDAVYRVDVDATDDDGTDFAGVVQWQWLDFGQPGVTKMLEGFDYVGEGQGPSVSFGYDQRNVAALTPAYAIDADTLAGSMIPYGFTAPTFSLRLDFAGGAEWRVLSANLYLHDDRAGS